MVFDVGRRGDQLEVVLALETFAHDVHVQQPQKAAAKAEAQRLAGLGLPRQGGVVQGELLERVTQLAELVALGREEPAEDHRMDDLVARQRLRGGPPQRRDGVADAHLGDLFDPGDDVADLAGLEALDRRHLGAEVAELLDLDALAGAHHLHHLVAREGAVDHANVGHHAAVLVVLRVEDQGPRGRLGVAAGTRSARHHGLEHLCDALAGLGRHREQLFVRGSRELVDLELGLGDVGGRQVDLVEHGDDLEVVVDGEIGVGHRLRLDALRGVDHEDGALAGGQRARDLVGEIDVAGCVDQVELVGRAVARPVADAHRLRLDRDAALALEVHLVEDLLLHVARSHRAGELEDAIGQGRFAVVDVGDDREVADVVEVHLAPSLAERPAAACVW